MCELRHTSLVVQKMTLRTERHLCPKTCPSLVLSPVLACPAFSWQVVAFSAVGDGGRRPREHDYLERWCGGSAHALSRCARFARMDSCDPLLATHLNPFDCASHAFGWRVGPGTLPPLPLPPLNRADPPP